LFRVSLDVDLECFAGDGDGEDIGAAADLAIFGVDLLVARAGINKRKVFFAAVGAVKSGGLFHVLNRDRCSWIVYSVSGRYR
jgi:hypothetical protein